MKNNRMRIISLILLFTMVFSLVAVPSVNADELLLEEEMLSDDGTYSEDDTFFEEDEIILEEAFPEEKSFFEKEPFTEQDLFSEDEISESEAENDEFVMMESNLLSADLVTATIPEEVTAPKDTYTDVTVTVEGGTAQSYKWQWFKEGSTKFNDVGTSGYRNADTDTIRILAGEGRNGWKYRCIVTLTDGSEVTSNEMTLIVAVTDVTINDVVYSKLTDTTCYVKAYIGNGTAVTVEANVNGLTVTEIGESAFEGKAIESIALPNSITVIHKYAFKNCTNLSSMTSY